jgi:hypothetical protein
MAEELTIADDLLEGADAIARFLWGPHASSKRVYRAIESKRSRLPIFKIGARIYARKSTLKAWVAAQECTA